MNIFLTLISQTGQPLFEGLFTKYMRFPWLRFSVLKLFSSSFQSREIVFVLQLPDGSSSWNKSWLINLFFAHFLRVFYVGRVKQLSLCSQLDCTLNQILNTIRKCSYKNPDEAICSPPALERGQTQYLKSAKTHCCPASPLTIMVSELCFYFYKPLLCFLHQTVISVCVVVLDAGSWDLCGVYKLILSSGI